MRKEKGFSLIELLIVVAIILIIAAIAIPNLLEARKRANESAAVGSVKTIVTSSVAYTTNHPNIGYPANLTALGPGFENMIDIQLAGGNKGGYTFTYTVTSTSACPTCVGGIHNDDFRLCADPNTPTRTGDRSFVGDASAVIYFVPVGGGPGSCAAVGSTTPIG